MITSDCWWNAPGIPCVGRMEFSEPDLLPRKDRHQHLQLLVDECLRCPVIRECRIDALSQARTEYPPVGVQAGIIFTSKA